MSRKKLKITNQLPIETFAPVPNSSNKIQLKGCGCLSQCEEDVYLNFHEVFNTDDVFYYQLSCVCKVDGDTCTEIGLGYLESDHVLVRQRPMIAIENGVIGPLQEPLPFCPSDTSEYTAQIHMPTQLSEFLIEPNTFVYSDSLGFPQVVQLEKNSILARDGDTVCSLTFEQLAERLNEYTK